MAKRSAKTDENGGGRVNKSAAIRDYIRSHRKEGPKAVADALNAQYGWDIKPPYVSGIKNKMRKRRKARRAAAAASVVEGASGGGLNESALLAAKKMADEVGSIAEAKAALDLLGKLTK